MCYGVRRRQPDGHTAATVRRDVRRVKVLQDFKTANSAMADGDRSGNGRGGSTVSDMIGAVSRSMTDDSEAQLRARQVDAIRRLTLPLMTVHVVNVAALITVLWLTGQSGPTAYVWAGLLCALALNGAWIGWRARNRPAPRATSTRTVRRVILRSMVFGLIWAVPGMTFMPGLSGFPAVFGYLLLTGMISGGAFALYPIPAAGYAFIGPVIVSGIAGIAMTYGSLAIGPAIVAAMFFLVFRSVIRRHADLFVSEFLGRLELEKRNRLVEDLLEDARLEALGTRQMIEQRLARAEKIEAIGHLTGGIAHNFNNLLTTIQGNAELLRLDGRSDSLLTDPILVACRRGSDQVQRLLSIAGKQLLNPEPVALDDLVAGLSRVVEPSFGPAYRLRTRMEPGLPPVLADPAQLESAILNLLFNARDAMPKGGEIELSCRAAPAQGLLPRRSAVTFIEIRVHDTGHGMDAGTREKATDPFFTTKGLGGGSGLGLSSVAGFVRQSDGEIAIDSAPGKGTTVTLRLPSVRADGAGETDDAAPASAALEILVVEDFPDVRHMTQQMLESLGYSVLTASDDTEAMAIVTAAARIDAVLTDILLSGPVTGVHLARKIREVRPDLPVAFMTGWPGRDAEDGDDDAPDNAVLSKPFTRRQLDAHLRRTLGVRTGEVETRPA